MQKRLWITLMLLASSQVGLAEVYKTTSAEGVAVYTDNINTAYGYNTNTNKINVLDKLTPQNPNTSSNFSNSSSMAMPQTTDQVATSPQTTVSTETATDTTFATKQVQASKKGEYLIQLVSPQNEMAYRRPAQSIQVSVKLNRPLKTGDRIIYRLNDKTLATTKDLHYSIATTNLDPQKYTITVSVQNVLGEIMASDSAMIYVISNNLIFQQKRKAFEASQKAKASLPWYKKIKAL